MSRLWASEAVGRACAPCAVRLSSPATTDKAVSVNQSGSARLCSLCTGPSRELSSMGVVDSHRELQCQTDQAAASWRWPPFTGRPWRHCCLAASSSLLGRALDKHESVQGKPVDHRRAHVRTAERRHAVLDGRSRSAWYFSDRHRRYRGVDQLLQRGAPHWALAGRTPHARVGVPGRHRRLSEGGGIADIEGDVFRGNGRPRRRVSGEAHRLAHSLPQTPTPVTAACYSDTAGQADCRSARKTSPGASAAGRRNGTNPPPISLCPLVSNRPNAMHCLISSLSLGFHKNPCTRKVTQRKLVKTLCQNEKRTTYLKDESV